MLYFVSPRWPRLFELRNSISGQLTGLLLVVALPLLGMLAGVLVIAAHDLRRTAEGLVQRLALTVATEVEHTVVETQNQLKYLAARPLVRALDGSHCDPILEDLNGLIPEYVIVGYMDARGTLVCSNRPSQEVNFSDRDYFRRAMAGESSVAGEPVRGRISGRTVVPFAHPILDANGHPHGVIAISTDVERLQSRVSARVLPAGSVVTVISPRGTVAGRTLNADRWIGLPADPAYLARQQGEGVGLMPGLDGVPRIYAFRSVNQSGWLVSAGIPAAAVYGPLKVRFVQVGAAFLGVLVLIVWIATRWSRRLQRPIAALARAADAIAGGDPAVAVAEDGPHELVVMARAFNRMQQRQLVIEQDLQRHSKQLEAANEELDSFAYSVSHDLRAPLRAMDGFSAILVKDYGANLNPEAKDYLARVRSGAKRMGQLIDDILRLSRTTRGDVQVQAVDLSAMARECAAQLQAQEPARRLVIAVQEGARVVGDPRLMRLVLENLLSNAWKFTSKVPQAHVSFEAVREGDEMVCTVRDDGAGFDMAFAGNLFKPFSRLHRPDEFPGNGIGLATVRRILTRLEGRVWAESTPGAGAAFHFALRCA